jgi:hypothetical protein
MEMTDDQKLEAREAKRKIKKEYRKTPKKWWNRPDQN